MDFLLVFLFVLALELVFLLVQRDGDGTAEGVAGLLAGSTTASTTTSSPHSSR